MLRYNIINYLIQKHNYQKYLEIGVEDGDCIQQIRCAQMDGVDPVSRGIGVTYKMTSDRFFEQLHPNVKYDIIFIDGLHTDEQVMRDIVNSLNHLSPGGTIVVHDCNPPSEWHQRSYEEAQSNGCRLWNGTVWKSIVRLRETRPDLTIHTVDTDWGVGLIRLGSQELLTNVPETLTYSDLADHRTDFLNLISPSQFLEYY